MITAVILRIQIIKIFQIFKKIVSTLVESWKCVSRDRKVCCWRSESVLESYAISEAGVRKA